MGIGNGRQTCWLLFAVIAFLVLRGMQYDITQKSGKEFLWKWVIMKTEVATSLKWLTPNTLHNMPETEQIFNKSYSEQYSVLRYNILSMYLGRHWWLHSNILIILHVTGILAVWPCSVPTYFCWRIRLSSCLKSRKHTACFKNLHFLIYSSKPVK